MVIGNEVETLVVIFDCKTCTDVSIAIVVSMITVGFSTERARDAAGLIVVVNAVNDQFVNRGIRFGQVLEIITYKVGVIPTFVN